MSNFTWGMCMNKNRKGVKHNKLRNSGLLFEFLLRQVTSDILNKDSENRALKIIKKRFNEYTELGKELTLYNVLINQKFDSDKKADFFITEAIKSRKKINDKVLRREKYNLIKEISQHFDLNKFLSSKVVDYKVYASAYKLFNHYDDLSPEEKTIAHFNLIENITTHKNKQVVNKLTEIDIQDTDLRILTYRVLLEKFNQKYDHLDTSQKNLLREYINSVSNTASLKEYVNRETKRIKLDLKRYSKRVDDKVTGIKLNEAANSIDKFCGVLKSTRVSDKAITQLMRYYQLVKELKKV